jgi:hypothetical protein
LIKERIWKKFHKYRKISQFTLALMGKIRYNNSELKEINLISIQL